MNDRKKPVTYKDIALAFALGDHQMVNNLLVGHTRPTEALGKAIEILSESGQDLSSLETLRQKFENGKIHEQRGRKPVSAGMSRTYSVQQVNDGECFIRVPLTLFGAKKGNPINVTFENEKITLTKF